MLVSLKGVANYQYRHYLFLVQRQNAICLLDNVLNTLSSEQMAKPIKMCRTYGAVGWCLFCCYKATEPTALRKNPKN